MGGAIHLLLSSFKNIFMQELQGAAKKSSSKHCHDSKLLDLSDQMRTGVTIAEALLAKNCKNLLLGFFLASRGSWRGWSRTRSLRFFRFSAKHWPEFRPSGHSGWKKSSSRSLRVLLTTTRRCSTTPSLQTGASDVTYQFAFKISNSSAVSMLAK